MRQLFATKVIVHLACSTSCLEYSYSALGLSSRKGLQILAKWLSRPRKVAWSHLGFSISTGEGTSSISPPSPRPLTSAMHAITYCPNRGGGAWLEGDSLICTVPFPYIPVSILTDQGKLRSGENAKTVLVTKQTRIRSLVGRKSTKIHHTRCAISLHYLYQTYSTDLYRSLL